MSIIRVNSIQSSIGSTAISIDSSGNCNFSGAISQGGTRIIQWVEITPAATEWSFSGRIVSQLITLNPSTIPSNARYVLGDVFITCNTSDHQNIVLGRQVLTDQKNWVDTRGQQPSTQFGAGLVTRQSATFSYNGDADNYSPNYGLWWSSQYIPCNGRTIYFNNFGNNGPGNNGWVYIIIKAYSL